MRSFNVKAIKKIACAPRVYFFFDYDGTLTPIVSTPGRARLKGSARMVLRRLSGLPGVKVAIVSGRSLPDLENMVGPVPEIVYVGNHGLEIKGDGFCWRHPSVDWMAKIMGRIWNELSKNLRSVKGMILENKTFGISLHYRLVPEFGVADLYRDFREIIDPWVQLGVVSVQEGKKVWEVRFRLQTWNKGKVVRWLLRKFKKEGRFFPVFVGDDKTDEDAFKALQGWGITVKVTENPRALSTARYYLHSPREVFDLLEQVIKTRGRDSKRVFL